LPAGVDGVVLQEEESEEIVQAIEDIFAGRIYVSDGVLAAPAEDAKYAA